MDCPVELSGTLLRCWTLENDWLVYRTRFLLYGSVVFAVVRIEALLVINGWQLESLMSFFVRYR